MDREIDRKEWVELDRSNNTVDGGEKERAKEKDKERPRMTTMRIQIRRKLHTRNPHSNESKKQHQE